MRILTCDQVREAEQEAISRPEMSALVLMHRAGHAVAQFCLSHFKFNSVCVVCGKGNNGGDGLVAAEALREIAARVSVVILARDVAQLSPDAAAMCSRLNLEPIWVANEEELDRATVREALDADLIIDAIVGTGFKPPLRGLARKAVDAMNNALGTVVAVDLPSGVDADSRAPLAEDKGEMVFAHGIVTFIAPKPAHVFGELITGPVAVSELGVQPVLISSQLNLQVATGQEVGITFPPRVKDAHKGQFGHVLVVAGSQGKAGAAAMAGMAALRTGAGLVTVACPASVQSTISGFAPELMTEALPETSEGSISLAASHRLTELLADKDVMVLGPGLSRNQETAKLVRQLISNSQLPVVLDADGLNAFDGHYNQLKASSKNFLVLTPHPGEAARLVGASTKEIQANRMDVAQRIARDTGACVVLKGSQTIIAGASGEVWINMTGNPALAKGGSGDVLSGITGAALARHGAESGGGQHSDKAALFLKDIRVAAAVHLHGLAGDVARDQLHENTVLATDVIESLSEAFRDCEQQMDRQLFYLQK